MLKNADLTPATIPRYVLAVRWSEGRAIDRSIARAVATRLAIHDSNTAVHL